MLYVLFANDRPACIMCIICRRGQIETRACPEVLRWTASWVELCHRDQNDQSSMFLNKLVQSTEILSAVITADSIETVEANCPIDYLVTA
jgi:hypothetical protein